MKVKELSALLALENPEAEVVVHDAEWGDNEPEIYHQEVFTGRTEPCDCTHGKRLGWCIIVTNGVMENQNQEWFTCGLCNGTMQKKVMEPSPTVTIS